MMRRDYGIAVNGIWGKILTSLGVAGLIAAAGAALRLEVLAAELESHESHAHHDGDTTVEAVHQIRESLVRQEAINEKVEETAEKVEKIDRKLDILLLKQGLDPTKAEQDQEP